MACRFPIALVAVARILLVEDTELVRDVLRSGIEASGHRADCVRTKAEAVTALGQVAYDLLICDLRLPDGSGHDLVRRASDLGMRCVVMSGHPDDLTDSSIATLPRVVRLQKPFRLPDLKKAIEQSLRV